MIEVRQLTGHAHGSAGHGGREGGQRRLEEADVRIQRRILETQVQFGVHLRRHRDPAGAGDQQTW
jgi:hypothetical protein